MGMKQAREIMIPLQDFAYIPYWFTLRQAMAELVRTETERKHRRQIPWLMLVFSAQNQLLGFIRRQEIMKGLLPEQKNQPTRLREKLFDVSVDPDLVRLSLDGAGVVSALQQQIDRPASDFMLPIKTTVDAHENLPHVMYLMIRDDVGFLPVVQDGQVVGIIDAVDALNEIIKVVMCSE